MTIRSDAHGDGGFAASRGSRGQHHALDISAPVGTLVRPVDRGFVLSMCNNDTCAKGNAGRYVQVAHEDADGSIVSISTYAHLSAVNGSLQVGSDVGENTNLGRVGTTGNAAGTDPHLHLGLTDVSGDTPAPLNPADYINVHRKP